MSTGLEFERDGEALRVQLAVVEDGCYRVTVGDVEHQVRACRLPDGRVRFELGGRVHVAAASAAGGDKRRGDVQVAMAGRTYVLRAPAAAGRRRGDVEGSGVILAPMTGTILKLAVAVGDRVGANDTVAVVTAMKMEHKLVAGVDGTVAEVAAEEGATVDQDTLLVRIEPDADAPD